MSIGQGDCEPNIVASLICLHQIARFEKNVGATHNRAMRVIDINASSSLYSKVFHSLRYIRTAYCYLSVRRSIRSIIRLVKEVTVWSGLLLQW